MQNMKGAKEYFEAAPKGRYRVKITKAEATFSKKSNAPMIALTAEIRDEGEHVGKQIDDWMITDGTFKGGGIGKRKLRGLGLPVDTDQVIEDSQIVSYLIGLECYADLDTDQMMGESVAGSKVYDRPLTVIDPTTGQTLPRLKNTIENYYLHTVAAQPMAPAPMAQPVMQAPVVQQFVPTQAPVAPPPAAFVPQMQPQAAPQAPQAWAPQAAPQMQMQMQPQAAPWGAPQAQGAVPPWVAPPPPGAQQMVPPNGSEEKKGRGRKSA